MSMDTVDDLDYAEGVLVDAGAMPADYCRPTCGVLDGDDCLTGDTCGCPCHDREPEPTTDADTLDMLAAWFIDNTDEDGQWGSAADFIEYAAKLITRTGRNIDPDACPDDPDGLHHVGCGCD